MDATFGVCKKKILLFNILVVNECNQGIPVGYIVFGAKLYSSSCDGDTLAVYFSQFSQAVTTAHQKEHLDSQEIFVPRICALSYAHLIILLALGLHATISLGIYNR